LARRFSFRVGGTNTPVVTLSIMGVCVFVYLLQVIPGLHATDALLYSPIYSLGEFVSQGVPYEPWRMITAMFAHSVSSGGFFGSLPLHLLLNMFTLWMFGQVLETMLGRLRYLGLYMVSGFAGSIGVFLWALIDTNTIPNAMIGASGAIFGLMAAYVVIQRRSGANISGMLALIILNLVIGFLPGSGISWQAHLGGLLGGAVVGLVFTTRLGSKPRRNQSLMLAGFTVVLCLIALSHAPIIVGA
jgi:membrane associated rhomboid family serine protease